MIALALAALLASPQSAYPPDYPDAAKTVVPGVPGVPQGIPKNPPPIRGSGKRGDSWPILVAGKELMVEVWATDMPHVMHMEFLPSGDMLVAERKGTVRLLGSSGAPIATLLEVPDVYFVGDCGLMSAALHPKFAKTSWVYLYFGDRKNNDCRIVRYTLSGRGKERRLTEPKVIMAGIPLNNYHAAGVIRFGPDGKLYASTGDCWKKETAQDVGHLGGKFLRLNDDGTVPRDNPFIAVVGARPELFAIGTRNAQGMDWHPSTGAMITTEHGPSGEEGLRSPRQAGDEVNLVTAGANLGWPMIHNTYAAEGLVSPLITSNDVFAPGSGMFYRGTATPTLTNSYFVGCLRGHALGRVEFAGNAVKSWTSVLEDLGRIRALAEGPLDFLRNHGDRRNRVLYFASSNADRYGAKGPHDDRIFRFVPR